MIVQISSNVHLRVGPPNAFIATFSRSTFCGIILSFLMTQFDLKMDHIYYNPYNSSKDHCMSPIDSKKSSIPTFLQWINKQQYMSFILQQAQQEQ